MSKLKVSIKKSTVTAMMKAGRKERINENELSQLARIKPCGIMHVTKTKKDSVVNDAILEAQEILPID